MGITISHESALQALRKLRCDGKSIAEMDRVNLREPSTWVGKRWRLGEFQTEAWLLEPPSAAHQMHVLTPTRVGRIRMSNVVLHVVRNLPPCSAIQVNPNISCVCPELLFFQMATSMELAKAVMIGYELCGNFAIQPANRHAKAATLIPAATCVEDLARYIDSLDSKRGIVRAREVLSYVSDGAISVPEAAIATMYSLPSDCGGYGLGTVTLNQRVLADPEEEDEEPTRFPDLLLSFVPIGVNYDGEKDHLDLDGLVAAVRTAEYAEGDESNEARDALAKKTCLRARKVYGRYRA